MRLSKRTILSLAIGIPLLDALIVALVAGFVVSGAHAAGHGTTLYVGSSAGANTGCASPGYTSIQAAVDAAPAGASVYLCGTTPYAEQVIISKSLTLTGDAGAAITAPATFPASALSRLPAQFTTDSLFVPQAIVVVWGSSTNVTISGLTVSGVLPGNGGCAEQEFGIVVIAGATANISNDRVLDIRDSNAALYGCQFGVGIQIGREYWPTADFSNFLVENFVGHANISGTTVSGYEKNGMTIDGPGTTADVNGNTVTGGGPYTALGAIVAQNGIQMSRGAGGQIRNNTVSANQYTGLNFASSSGVIVFGGCGDPVVTGVQVMKNTLVNNDVGIYLNNYDDACDNVTTTQTNDKAVNNTISNDAVTNVSGFGTYGYQAGVDDIGVNDKIINNDISGAGYAPQTAPNGPFVLPVDTQSFPTTSAKVHANNSK